jgi:Tol biopolymer transport system component
VPPDIQRILRRCLEKEPVERFQSAWDLAFAITAAREDLALAAPPARAPNRTLAWVAGVAGIAGLALAATMWTGRSEVAPPPSVATTSVVPPSARPIAPALSPDGKWVAYVSVAETEPQIFVQFLNGGVPFNLTAGMQIPIPNRTIVGGIDIAPDGSAIGFAGRPRATGLWTIPGVWTIPAPQGGPPRRVNDRFGSVRWSPDGRRFAAVLANPLIGDAVVVSDTDGQHERVLVPAGGGLHLHQVAWAPDGTYVYYAQSFDPNHSVGEIYRVPAAGGTPERVVETAGLAVHPAPTADGTAVIYAGNHQGEGLNLWWHPLDGSPEHRLTAGAGEYTEPYLSRDGTMLVCLARRRRGELVRLRVDGPGPAIGITIGVPGSGDGEPSAAVASDRIFISSPRSGGRKIWSIDASGGQPRPLTSGEALDHRPVVSPDGRLVAFNSNRDGQWGTWIVPSDGGTPRLLVRGAVLDRASWSADSRRIVYALAGKTAATLWTVTVDGGTPTQIESASGRVPTWSPGGDAIAVVRSDNDHPTVHFITAAGARAREPLAIDPIGLPAAVAWSPDGRRIAIVNLPGRSAAEVWILTLADGALRKLTQFAAPGELDGITWTADSGSVVVGRTEYETEVLLLRGVR